jgi:hypothetical protein
MGGKNGGHMSRDSTTFSLPYFKEDVLELACQIAVNHDFAITSLNESGFTAKEAFTMGFTWPVTLEARFKNEGGGTRVTLNGSNFGLGPVQMNHVQRCMTKVKNELVNSVGAMLIQEVVYPEFPLEEDEMTMPLRTNGYYSTQEDYSLKEKYSSFLNELSSDQVRIVGYSIGAIVGAIVIYKYAQLFFGISLLICIAWTLEMLGFIKVAKWSIFGRLKQKSKTGYEALGIISYIVLVISFIFLKVL